jgi:hypothetical protein
VELTNCGIKPVSVRASSGIHVNERASPGADDSSCSLVELAHVDASARYRLAMVGMFGCCGSGSFPTGATYPTSMGGHVKRSARRRIASAIALIFLQVSFVACGSL